MDRDREMSQVDVLPALDPLLATLPPSPFPYRVTFSDLHQVFVVEAPFRERREVLFAVFTAFAASVWEILPAARLWVDGGFVTHKTWGAPEDIDVAIIVDKAEPSAKRRLVQSGLLTMEDVTARINDKNMPPISKLQPFGGNIDSYFATDMTREFIRRDFSRVKGPDGALIEGATKGFVEVVRGLD